jgi:hypothetical protein
MQNENLLSLVVDIRNQPALVMADVKHSACPNAVCIPPTLLYIWKISPQRAFGDFYTKRLGTLDTIAEDRGGLCLRRDKGPGPRWNAGRNPTAG